MMKAPEVSAASLCELPAQIMVIFPEVLADSLFQLLLRVPRVNQPTLLVNGQVQLFFQPVQLDFELSDLLG